MPSIHSVPIPVPTPPPPPMSMPELIFWIAVVIVAVLAMRWLYKMATASRDGERDYPTVRVIPR